MKTIPLTGVMDRARGGLQTTPSHSVVIASPARRAAAYLVDLVVLKLIGAVLGLIIWTFFDLSLVKIIFKPNLLTDFQSYRKPGLGLALFGELVVALGYFSLLEASGGQTIGKRLFNLMVLNRKGQPLTCAEGVQRNLTRTAWFIPGYLGPLLAILELFTLIEAPHQRIGDKLVGSYVVQATQALLFHPDGGPSGPNGNGAEGASNEPVVIINVQGDYIAGDKTVIQDSVVNRSNINSSTEKAEDDRGDNGR